MENNDLPRFVATHSLQQTRMAAAFLFALPGIPLIYNGQEAGVKTHPYSGRPIFKDEYTIRQQDSSGLFDHYKKLIASRLKYPALTGANINEVKLDPSHAAIAFHRWEGKEHMIIILNADSIATEVAIITDSLGIIKSREFNMNLTDVLTGQKFTNSRRNRMFRIKMDGYSVRWLSVQKK
jgi:glycosidase